MPTSPSSRASRPRGAIIAGGTLLVVIAVVVVVIATRHGGSPSPGPSTTPGVPSSTDFPSSRDFPSSTPGGSSATDTSITTTDTSVTTTTGALGVTDARAIVERYLQDINRQNRGDAATLICPNLVATWRNSIDKASGDFTVAVIKATFASSTPSTDGSNGLDLKYSLNVKDPKSSTTAVTEVTFMIAAKAGGLRICGEVARHSAPRATAPAAAPATTR